MRYIIIFIFIFLLYNCSHTMEIIFESYHDIELTPLEYPDLIGIPLEILKKDNYLLIADFSGDSLISVFNIDNKRINKMASVGKGPGEVIPPITMQLYDEKLYICSRGNFIFYNILSSEIGKDKTKFIKLFNAPPQTDQICVLSEGKYVSTGFFQNQRYNLLDSAGNIMKTFGEFPDLWDEEKHIPNEAKALFHQCSMHKNPQKSLFATVASHVLEIWAFDDDSFQRISQIKAGAYQYLYLTGNRLKVKRTGSTTRGMRSANCTEKYIYAVYKTDDVEMTSVWVFDWMGRPVKCLRSEKDIYTLCVDEVLQVAYCIVFDPEPVLMSFNIP